MRSMCTAPNQLNIDWLTSRVRKKHFMDVSRLPDVGCTGSFRLSHCHVLPNARRKLCKLLFRKMGESLDNAGIAACQKLVSLRETVVRHFQCPSSHVFYPHLYFSTFALFTASNGRTNTAQSCHGILSSCFQEEMQRHNRYVYAKFHTRKSLHDVFDVLFWKR